MNRIKDSDCLQSYLRVAEQLQQEIGPEMVDMIEEEKSVLDSKIGQSRFAYLLLKHKYYKSMDESFSKFNKNTEETILKTRELEKDILSIDSDLAKIKAVYESFLGSVLKVDTKPVSFG